MRLRIAGTVIGDGDTLDAAEWPRDGIAVVNHDRSRRMPFRDARGCFEPK
jgi:hypothetical protein